MLPSPPLPRCIARRVDRVYHNFAAQLLPAFAIAASESTARGSASRAGARGCAAGEEGGRLAASHNGSARAYGEGRQNGIVFLSLMLNHLLPNLPPRTVLMLWTWCAGAECTCARIFLPADHARHPGPLWAGVRTTMHARASSSPSQHPYAAPAPAPARSSLSHTVSIPSGCCLSPPTSDFVDPGYPLLRPHAGAGTVARRTCVFRSSWIPSRSSSAPSRWESGRRVARASSSSTVLCARRTRPE
ncbi:hypothetical protein B0H19DRAFT_1123117 [Mycena capillaripes]|nr:hypothetical protein B0H19DRAFT_1123117 [Mycena capillaripes]